MPYHTRAHFGFCYFDRSTLSSDIAHRGMRLQDTIGYHHRRQSTLAALLFFFEAVDSDPGCLVVSHRLGCGLCTVARPHLDRMKIRSDPMQTDKSPINLQQTSLSQVHLACGRRSTSAAPQWQAGHEENPLPSCRRAGQRAGEASCRTSVRQVVQ
jgi:hypothetical protein